MLAERRFFLSLVSNNLIASGQNLRFATPRHTLSSGTRKRRARKVVSTSLPQSGTFPQTNSHSRRRTRRRILYRIRTAPTAPNDHAQMATGNNPQQVPPTQSHPSFVLPRRLIRPRFRAIDIHIVVSIDPLLGGIPLGYIQHSLREIGPQLLRATCNATATPPSGSLPRELKLVCNDVSVEPPSHIIAAYSHSNARVTLFPVHALILAANCANVPALPPSKPDMPATAGGTVMIPVVPIRIPSLTAFPSLLSFLYTKRADQLLTELLPSRGTPSSLAQLVRAHAAALSAKALIIQVRKVHGLWSNAAALGVFDDNLFQALEMAWEVLLSALAMKTGQSVDAGVNVDEEPE